jgi:protein arginine N-methyltransferase 1
MTLAPSVKLRCAPALRVTCNSTSQFTLEVGSKRAVGGANTLAILNAFRTPNSLGEAVKHISAQLTGVHDWIDLTSQIVNFHRAGMLLDDQAVRESESLDDKGRTFGSAPVHIAMLNDRERTRRYIDAIKATVRPGDVVVDMGTGSGVMAVAAAQSGAARVYAIEATGIAKAARRVFEANGVADRITLIEGYSTQVQLPERADVLVAEVIGNEPLAERILECTADAVQRFIKPDGKLIPFRLRVMAVPVELPSSTRDWMIIREPALADWKEQYGIDFSPLAELANNSAVNFNERPAVVAKWTTLAASQVVSDFDLCQPIQASRETSCEFRINREGQIDGFVLWFCADLVDGNQLSTDPGAPRPDNHWTHPVHVLAQPLPVHPGNAVRLWLEGEGQRTARAEVVG